MAAVVAATFMNIQERNNGEVPPSRGSKARAEKIEREMKMQAKNEAILKNMGKVRSIREKIKMSNTALGLDTEEGKRTAAAWRIQLFVRGWKHRKIKCHRENLGARLIFEEDIKTGVWRLLTQVSYSTVVGRLSQSL
jgi:hypothetical protein